MDYKILKDELNRYESDLKKLKFHDVFLAEFECLYDQDNAKFGQIDPNALSAGGFPFLFLNGLLEEFHAYKLKNLTLPSSAIQTVVYERIQSILSDKFEFSGKLLKSTSSKVVNKLGEVFLWDISDEILDCIEHGLNNLDFSDLSLVNSKFNNNVQACELLFSDKYTICFIHTKLWTLHRLALIKSLEKQAETTHGFNSFTSMLIKQIFLYINYFISSSGILDNLSSNELRVVSDYKVSWESDLGYLVKYELSKKHKNIHTNVLHDLHSKTNLFIPMPVKCYMGILNSKKTELLYDLMLHNIREDNTSTYLIKHVKKNYPYITYDKNNKTCQLVFDKDISLKINNAYTAQDSLTEYYIQYAYLYKDFPKDKIDITNKCSRLMYLSSFLNAKAAIFKIYEEIETNYAITIERPPTKLSFSNKINVNDYLEYAHAGKVILKEGGVCSTGGSEVDFLSVPNDRSYLTNYVRPVIQKYVPSHIFMHHGSPVHAHCRKISVMDASGNVCHLGYVFKVSYEGKSNSSGFVTITLCYDEQGTFIYGTEISKRIRYFYELADAGISLNISEESFKLFLYKVKLNWVKAIWALNKYLEHDFRTSINALVAAKIIDAEYLLK